MSKYTVVAILHCKEDETIDKGFFLVGFLFEDTQKNIYRELDISKIKQQLTKEPNYIEGLLYNKETKALEYPEWIPTVKIYFEDYYSKYNERFMEIESIFNLTEEDIEVIKDFAISPRCYIYSYLKGNEHYRLSMINQYFARLKTDNVNLKGEETIVPSPPLKLNLQTGSAKLNIVGSLFSAFDFEMKEECIKLSFEDWDFSNFEIFASMFRRYKCTGDSSINMSNKVLGTKTGVNDFREMFSSTCVHNLNLSNTRFRGKCELLKPPPKFLIQYPGYHKEELRYEKDSPFVNTSDTKPYYKFFNHCSIDVLDLRGSNLLHNLNEFIENEIYPDAKSMIEDVFLYAKIKTLLLDNTQESLSFIDELKAFLRHSFIVCNANYNNNARLIDIPPTMDWST